MLPLATVLPRAIGLVVVVVFVGVLRLAGRRLIGVGTAMERRRGRGLAADLRSEETTRLQGGDTPGDRPEPVPLTGQERAHNPFGE